MRPSRKIKDLDHGCGQVLELKFIHFGKRKHMGFWSIWVQNLNKKLSKIVKKVHKTCWFF